MNLVKRLCIIFNIIYYKSKSKIILNYCILIDTLWNIFQNKGQHHQVNLKLFHKILLQNLLNKHTLHYYKILYSNNHQYMILVHMTAQHKLNHIYIPHLANIYLYYYNYQDIVLIHNHFLQIKDSMYIFQFLNHIFLNYYSYLNKFLMNNHLM